MTYQLSEEQIAAFHRDGFLRIEDLTTPEEIEVLRKVYDKLFARGSAAFADGDHLELTKLDEDGVETLPQILSPEKYAPELVETRARANALSIAKQLLGDDTKRGGDHAILKPPGLGAPTPWHQDEAYWNPAYEHSSLSVWMPLQEATVENGCMHFLPASHNDGVVPHHIVDVEAHALEADEAVDESKAVACPLSAGGCTIHHCRTVHYAGPNRSDGPRRAYIMGFAAPPRQLDTPNDYYWQRPDWK